MYQVLGNTAVQVSVSGCLTKGTGYHRMLFSWLLCPRRKKRKGTIGYSKHECKQQYYVQAWQKGLTHSHSKYCASSMWSLTSLFFPVLFFSFILSNSTRWIVFTYHWQVTGCTVPLSRTLPTKEEIIRWKKQTSGQSLKIWCIALNTFLQLDLYILQFRRQD